MFGKNFWLSKQVFASFIFGILLVSPILVFGGSDVLYVDNDANGDEQGTKAHPYHSIEKALKHADDGTEVRVRKGTYKENITISKDIKVTGDSEDADKVTIESDDNDKPSVTMKNGTELSHVTVKGGRHGIRVLEDSKVHIFDVHIKKSKRDGIHIESGSREKKDRALIDDVRISGSGQAGIFAEKRFIVLINSDIVTNAGDGIDLAGGTKAWIENNRFNENGGSGAKFVMDGSDIWTKSNSFRNNKREGVEVNAYGTPGNIGFKKASFVNNGRYGIARIARATAGFNTFDHLFYNESGVNSNRIEGNIIGTVSLIMRGF
ncbi:MAG: right-handed parallel beta-helix repeat-containing protein [Minisyncoccota bacterium]